MLVATQQYNDVLEQTNYAVCVCDETWKNVPLKKTKFLSAKNIFKKKIDFYIKRKPRLTFLFSS